MEVVDHVDDATPPGGHIHPAHQSLEQHTANGTVIISPDLSYRSAFEDFGDLCIALLSKTYQINKMLSGNILSLYIFVCFMMFVCFCFF